MKKAVLFDFDNTLANRERSAYLCYKDVITQSVDTKDPVEIEAIVQDAVLYDQAGDVPKQYVIDKLEQKYPFKVVMDDFQTYWNERFYTYTILFEDTLETLETLKKKGIKIGIVTNGDAKGQRHKLEYSKVIDYVDCVVVSREVGLSKPDPAIFELAMQQLQVKPEECLFVGDLYGRDILGAYRAKIQPLWMCRYHEVYQETDIPLIHQIKEVLDYLEEEQ